MKLVHWPLMGGLLAYIWYSDEGPEKAAVPPVVLFSLYQMYNSPRCSPINGQCTNQVAVRFNVPIKGLTRGGGELAVNFAIECHAG